MSFYQPDVEGDDDRTDAESMAVSVDSFGFSSTRACASGASIAASVLSTDDGRSPSFSRSSVPTVSSASDENDETNTDYSSSVSIFPFMGTGASSVVSSSSVSCPWRLRPSPSSDEGHIGLDGRTYMVRWESKESSMERNIPMPRPPKDYNVSREIRKQLFREETIMQMIQASFYQKTSSFGGNDETPLPFNRHFLVVHFGDYYTNFRGAHPGEFAIADFSVRDGIDFCFSRMLDPGSIPLGFRADFCASAEEKGYELPGFDPGMDYGVECLDVIENLIAKYITDDDPHGTLYTIRPDVDNVKQCLRAVAEKTGRSFSFKVFSMSRLVELLFIEGEHLRSLNRIEPTSIVYSEENALALLARGEYDAYVELGCNFHTVPSKLDTLEFCSLNLVKRWIYNSLGLLTKLYCCPMYMHNHVPKLDNTPCFHVEEGSSYDLRCSTPGDWSWVDTPSVGAAGGTQLTGTYTPTTAGSVVTARHSLNPREYGQSTSTRYVTETGGNLRQRYDSSSTLVSGVTEAVPGSNDSVVGSMTSGGREIELKIHRFPNEDADAQGDHYNANMPEERELTKEDFVTIQIFPDLNREIRLDPADRAMDVFRMPDMKKRQYPPISDVVELMEFVPGYKSNGPHRSHPKPPTVLTLVDEDLEPVSCDYSFHPKKKSSRAGSIASSDSNFSSVSKTAPLPEPQTDPFVMEQAHKLLNEGVLPQTQFVETGQLFWDTDPQYTVQRRGGGRGRPRPDPQPEPVVPRGQIPLPGVGPSAVQPVPGPLSPPLPRPGRGRGLALFWDRVNALPNPNDEPPPNPNAHQPQGLPPAGLEDEEYDWDDDESLQLSVQGDVFWRT